MNIVEKSNQMPSSPVSGAGSRFGTPEFELICLDARLRVVSATARAFRLFDVASAKGAPLKDSKVSPTVISLCEMALKSSQECHVVLGDPHGTGSELELVAIPIEDELSPVRVSLLIREAALSGYVSHNIRRLDRLANIGLFSASMAHEIKNALVAVKAFADLLVEKDQTNEMAAVMQRETARIENIVNRMLRFAGPMRQTITRFSVHDVLDHALRMLGRQIESQSHILERSYLATTSTIEGDQLQLEQAFVNLILNAIEAMERKGTLKISTSLVQASESWAPDTEQASLICVKVEDNGPGIIAENQKRLFEPFYTTKETGTGLGLPIARTIIIEHNGSINVHSEPGKGTTFSILLPLLE
jgi:signal transduction histidine kinase